MALGVLHCGAPSPSGSAPNVLLVTLDTLRADHLGVYGFEHATSPEIDALAEAGVVFERAIAAASLTTPAHASIMTSRFTREHAIGPNNGGAALRDETTLARVFRDHGYATAAFVSNLLLKAKFGLGAGFDTFDDELTTPEINRPLVVERRAADTTERALAWLSQAGDGPFFLWVHYQDPHGPYTPPPPDDERFRIPPAPGEQALPVKEGRDAIPAYQALDGLRLPSQYRSRYAGEIFYADRWVGRLVEAVAAHDPSRPSVVLLTADHGESFGENGRYFSHTHTTTPDVARVPMILRAPGLAPGRSSDLVHHVDVLPTLLDLAELPIPPEARGLPLARFVREGRSLPDRTVYCDIGRELSAYRGDSFLWVRDADAVPVRRWARFLWSPEGWSRQPGRSPLPEAVREYTARSAPVNRLPPPDEEMKRRLEALGYAEP